MKNRAMLKTYTQVFLVGLMLGGVVVPNAYADQTGATDAMGKHGLNPDSIGKTHPIDALSKPGSPKSKL